VRQNQKLSALVLALCQNPSVILYLSLVSLWEIQIKSSLGKLPLTLPLREIVLDQQAQCNLRLLPITPAHIFALESLPLHHNDPFDRLLIAQAISEGLPLASIDSQFSLYAVPVVW